MANLSAYFQDRILNHMFRGEVFVPPKNLYVALFVKITQNQPEGEEAPILEVVAKGYKRQPLTLSAPTNGVCDNPQELYFDRAEADWGRVVAVGVFDSRAGGNLLLSADLDLPQTVEEGSPFKIPVGEVTVSLL